MKRVERGFVELRTSSPNIYAKLQRAMDMLERDARRGGVLECGHARTVERLFVCTDHPAGGVRCERCAKEHTGRHTAEAERTCDECGEVVDGSQPWTIYVPTADMRGLPVRRPRGGRRGLLYGPLMLTGVAVCQRCRPMRRGVAA